MCSDEKWYLSKISAVCSVFLERAKAGTSRNTRRTHQFPHLNRQEMSVFRWRVDWTKTTKQGAAPG